MKRTLSWIAAASFLLAAGNLKAVEVEVPGLLTDHTVSSVGHSFIEPSVTNGTVLIPEIGFVE
jgi:hypothetical protein